MQYNSNILKRVDRSTYKSDSDHMHLIVEYIYRGRLFFNNKMYQASALIMHIPPPLQADLVASLHVYSGVSVVNKANNQVRIFGVLCVPSYENKIVISHPEYAIYENEPIVIIELDKVTNYPTYYEHN